MSRSPSTFLGLDRVQQRFDEQDIEAPRVGSLTWLAPSSDVIKFVAQFSHGNLETLCPRVMRQSTDTLGRIVRGFPREGGHGG